MGSGGLHSLEIWRESRIHAHIHPTEDPKLPGKLPGRVSCCPFILWHDRIALIPVRCRIGPAIAFDRLGLVFWEPGDGDPPVHAAMLRPLFVAAIGLEQVTVSFNNDPGIGEDARKLLSEVAVGEVDPTHAARA